MGAKAPASAVWGAARTRGKTGVQSQRRAFMPPGRDHSVAKCPRWPAGGPGWPHFEGREELGEGASRAVPRAIVPLRTEPSLRLTRHHYIRNSPRRHAATTACQQDDRSSERARALRVPGGRLAANSPRFRLNLRRRSTVLRRTAAAYAYDVVAAILRRKFPSCTTNVPNK